jgi:hypothetical protein
MREKTQRSSRAGRQKAASHLQAHRASGLSVAAYCRQAGISVSTFGYWQRRERGAQEPHTSLAQAQPSFVEVLRTAQPQPYRLELANGQVLVVGSGFRATEVRELLAILAGVDRC